MADASSTTGRRRWFGAASLAAAVAMLIAGDTVLKDRLSPLGFLFFWLTCLGLTGTAIIIAIRDFASLQRRAHEEQRRLFESALEEIARRKAAKLQEQQPPEDSSE